MEKKHIIYRTTNCLNGRFYIGMHSTDNIDDGYLGSGRRIKAEIKKYGKENFKREVLEELPSRAALQLREAELVTENLIAGSLCLNLKNGGEGGGRFWSAEHHSKCTEASLKSPKNRGEHRSRSATKSNATRVARGQKTFGDFHQGFLNKTHSIESRQQMVINRAGTQVGNRNSQFGSCWVTNGRPVKIKKEQLDEYLQNGYHRGRK